MSSPRRALHTAGLLLPLVLSHGLAAVDCNRNGIEDHLDVVQRRSDDCNANDVPDECDVRVVNLGYTLGSFMVPVRPMWLATGDLDGDGSIDIAAPCEPPGSVLLLWNQAPGFEDEVLMYPGTPVRLLETGDVDGDGRLDLVTATTDGIQVLINAGGRSLAPRELSGPPFEAGALALGDLNRDGDLDAVAAGPFHVAVLENVSGWTFEPVNRIVLGSGPIAVFIEDLEGDGDLDIVTGNSQGSVSAIFRRDDGTFAIPQNFSAGGLPSAAFASADLDRDSKADVAALSSRGEVTVLLQADGGRFAHAGTTPTGTFGTAIAAADLDVDGDPDLAAIHLEGLGIFRNRGDGSLAPEIRPGLPTPAFISPADLDGDGVPDLAAGYRERRIGVARAIPVANSLDCNADQVPDECQLGPSDCNGNSIPDGCDLAGSSRDCNGNLFPDECETDCDGNGAPDECDLSRWGKTRDCNGNGVLDVCDIGSGLLRFERSPRTDLADWSLPRRAASADLDGDENGDLVILGYHWYEARLGVLFQEDGRLDLRSLLAREGSLTAFDLGDLDRDGDVDLAAIAKGGRIHVYRNPGNGELAGPVGFEHADVYPYGEDLVLADCDGDGNLDAAARAGKNHGGIAVLWNDGRGSFPGASLVGAGTSIDGFRRADLDGNAVGDLLIVEEPESGRWQLLLLSGAAGRTFEAPRAFALEGQPSSLVTADLDRDGNEDITVPISGLMALWVFRNDGAGALDATRQPLSLPLRSVLSGDLNLDGHADLAGISILGSTEALLNHGDGWFGGSRRIAEDVQFISLADMNSDRAPDIVVAGEYYTIEFPAQSWLEVLANRSLAPESIDADGDGVPDECEDRPFRRGDVAADGRVDMADAITVMDALFRGRTPLECASSADVDGDGAIRITDAIFLLRHLFLGGAPPPFPGPPPSPCAPDPLPVARGGLGCAFHPGCDR